MKRRLLLPLIPAAACLAFAAPAVAAAPEAVSENWAGYEAQTSSGTGYSAVSGSWTQPAARCTTGSSSYGAFWVGLGGGSGGSQALEQTGTQADCTASGQMRSFAWYELVPAAPVKIPMTVRPGDHMYARVSVHGTSVRIQLTDQTSGARFDRTLTMTGPSPDTSTAEWIAEAPSQCAAGGQACQPLPLSDFGTVGFTHAYATAAGHTAPIGDWNAQAIALQPQSESFFGLGPGGYGADSVYGGYGDGTGMSASSTGATPSPLASSGTAFKVSAGTSGATAPTATSTATSPGEGDGHGGSGYGYGYGYGYGGYGGYGGDGGSGYGYGGASGYGGYGGGWPGGYIYAY